MGLPFFMPMDGRYPKIAQLMDLVDRAKQDARADGAIF